MSVASAKLFAKLDERKVFDILGSAGAPIDESVLNNVSEYANTVKCLMQKELAEYEGQNSNKVQLTEKGKKVYKHYTEIERLTKK